MATFYFTLRVTPTSSNRHADEVEGALASCWVCDDDPQIALTRGCLIIEQYDWDIIDVEDPPVVTTEENFIGKDIGLENYKIAQEYGISMVFGGWAKDRKSSYGPVKLERSDSYNLNTYLSEIKNLSKKGRCLHYDAGGRCSKIINAHSIQKQGALSLIAGEGEVYAISRNFSDIVRSPRTATFTKQGINTVSTFRGFCEDHDNELFEPIDKYMFSSTKQQILLYAYRSLCRELFVKENALALWESCYERHKNHNCLKDTFNNLRVATEFGLKNLLLHKDKLDSCLKIQSYPEIKYVIFCTNQQPSVVFSGLFYPDFDFLGRPLQDLSDHSRNLDLLTFCFVPMDKGWGILFAWHIESSDTCVPFMQSLASRICEDNCIGDHLFRMVISCCENLAIQPTWWESLKKKEREDITNAACHDGADMLSPIKYDYLAKGLENISEWHFENAITDME